MEKRKILIVDDEEDIRRLLAKFFEQKGYHSVAVESGLLGLNLLRTSRFDAVISDINLPYIDGIDFVRRAKKLNPDIVIILITGCGSLNTAQEAIKIGVHEYFTKPADTEKLHVSLETGLKQAEDNKKSSGYSSRLMRELEEDKKKLENMEKDLITLISHELKTPVALISEGFSLIKDSFNQHSPDSSNSQKDDLLKIVENGKQRLVKTIENITDYMHLSGKKVTLKLENTNLKVFLEENLNTLSQLALFSGASLKKEFSPDESNIACIDKDKILDVLIRIIHNAAYHNPKGTEITLKLSSTKDEKDSRAIISVHDNGKGMKKESLEDIFKPFNVKDIMHHTKGLGLGLCICKELINLHNGSIKIYSEEDKGTVVLIEIPKL